MSDGLICVTVYENIKTPVPIDQRVYAFKDLVELYPFEDVSLEDKAGFHLWSPVRLYEGEARGKKAVESAYCLVLDKDCGDTGELLAVTNHLMAGGWSFWVHTSFSHRLLNKEHKGTGIRGEFDCFRVVLPFSRPVTSPDDFKAIYQAVFKAGIVPMDPPKYKVEVEKANRDQNRTNASPRGWDTKAGSSIAQPWYPPCSPSTTAEYRHTWLTIGKELDVDSLLASVAGKAEKVKKGKFARALARSQGLETPQSKLELVLEKYASAMSAVGCTPDQIELDVECRSSCPCCGVESDSICARASTEDGRIIMTAYCPCDETEILAKIGLTWSDLTTGKLETIDKAMRRAFRSDRTDPYTAEELVMMEPTEHRWILQTPAGYFIRGPHGYSGPHPRDHVVNLARDSLAPAVSAGVELSMTTAKGGLRDLTLAELLKEYGQTPHEMQYSYCVPGATLEDVTFTQRAAPLRLGLEPERSEAVETWLKAFAGSEEAHGTLLDWLATCLQLERPTAALLIKGTSGAGKDLFVEGLARLWTGPLVPFHRAFAKHNDILIHSPLIFANETLIASGDYTWNPVEALKTAISDYERSVEPKNQKPVRLRGCSRVILATNSNRGSFNLGRTPTPSDLQALDERVILIQPTEAARDYLIQIGGHDTTREWVEGCALARHVLWLAKTRTVKPGTRFLVRGTGGMSTMMSADGKGSAVVLRAILRALTGKHKDDRVACVKRDEVWVSMSNLRERWSMYEKAEMPEDIGDVVTAICTEERRAIRTGKTIVKMRAVASSVLERAAINENMMEDLEELFGVTSESLQEL